MKLRPRDQTLDLYLNLLELNRQIENTTNKSNRTKLLKERNQILKKFKKTSDDYMKELKRCMK